MRTEQWLMSPNTQCTAFTGVTVLHASAYLILKKSPIKSLLLFTHCKDNRWDRVAKGQSQLPRQQPVTLTPGFLI